MHLNESCFPECWKVSWVIPVVKNVGERFAAKNYYPVSCLYVVSKVFEKFGKIDVLITWRNEAYILISSMVLVFSINCRSSNSCIW